MTKPQRSTEDRRLRRKTAAFRLKHDVGKALRWSAPDEREADAGALRARLANDLLPRTRGGGAERDVVETFFEWKREEGPQFRPSDSDLEAITSAMDRIAASRDVLLSGAEPLPAAPPSPSSTSKKSLFLSHSFSSLVALDEACLEASRRCTAFYRRVAVEEGHEIVRPASGIHPRPDVGGSGS